MLSVWRKHTAICCNRRGLGYSRALTPTARRPSAALQCSTIQYSVLGALRPSAGLPRSADGCADGVSTALCCVGLSGVASIGLSCALAYGRVVGVRREPFVRFVVVDRQLRGHRHADEPFGARLHVSQ